MDESEASLSLKQTDISPAKMEIMSLPNKELPGITVETPQQQIEALAAGKMMNSEKKVSEPTITEANHHIIRYGDPRLDEELSAWIKPGEEIHAKVFPTFRNGETIITLVGTAHTYESTNPLIADVVSTTQNYIDATPADKRMVMIEGIHSGTTPKWSDLPSAVASNGEMGAAGFIAQEADIPVISPEAPQSEVIDTLKKAGVPETKIATFYTLRNLPDLIKNGQLEPDKMASLLYDNSQEAGAGWTQAFSQEDMQQLVDNTDFKKAKVEGVLKESLPNFNANVRDTIKNWYTGLDEEMRQKIISGTNSSKEVEQRVFKQLLSLGEIISNDKIIELFNIGEKGIEVALDADTITYLTNPGNEAPETDLRTISRIDNETRDKYLLRSIDNATKNGKSPLVVFGGTHTIKIAPALSYLYQK